MTETTKILVVDEGPSALTPVLEELGYQVDELDGLEAAEGHLRELPVELVCCHLERARSGSLQSLLAACEPDSTPAVILFGADVSGDLDEMLGLKDVDFLLAPFHAQLVAKRLEVSLERRRLRLESSQREELLKLERDVQIGRDIQLGFLPQSLPQPAGWEVAAYFHPAREVAGDFYDAFYMINRRRIGFLIADVCDKGVGAALFMALFRTLIRSGAQHHTSLSWMDPRSGSITDNKDWLKGDLNQRRQSLPNIGTGALMNAVARTNDYITENHMEQGYFATVFFGVLDPGNGSLIYINGGHNPPVIVRQDGRRDFLKPTGPAVGMLPGVSYKMGQTRLAPGDFLYAYTDGVTDARSPQGAFFTEQRLFDLVGEGAASAQSLVERVEGELKGHIADAAQFDDITMIALRRAKR